MATFANAETLALHAGPRMDPATGAVAVPIFQALEQATLKRAEAA